MEIVVLGGKNDPSYFRTAVGAVEYRISSTYQYEGDDDLMQKARRIVDTNDERAALQLLRQRDGYEYEDFDVVAVGR